MIEVVTVLHIEDHGTIVQVWVRRHLTGAVFPVNFDHRPWAEWHCAWEQAGAPEEVGYDREEGTLTVDLAFEDGA
jgi:hypothetical protein